MKLFTIFISLLSADTYFTFDLQHSQVKMIINLCHGFYFFSFKIMNSFYYQLINYGFYFFSFKVMNSFYYQLINYDKYPYKINFRKIIQLIINMSENTERHFGVILAPLSSKNVKIRLRLK